MGATVDRWVVGGGRRLSPEAEGVGLETSATWVPDPRKRDPSNVGFSFIPAAPQLSASTAVKESDEERWERLLREATLGTPVVAQSFVKAWPTFSRPVSIEGDDGHSYVVKGLRTDQPAMPHAITTERTAGLLGQALGAPVPDVVLVDVSGLVAVEPAMAHMIPGVVHGTRELDHCSERLAVTAPGTDRNKKVFAGLAVLYGWFQAADHQLVATMDPPGDVYSVDHGHFLPGGPTWSAATLLSASPPAPDPNFAPHTRPADLEEVARRLEQIDDRGIAQALGQPTSWGVPLADRVALGQYLSSRRVKMIELLGG